MRISSDNKGNTPQTKASENGAEIAGATKANSVVTAQLSRTPLSSETSLKGRVKDLTGTEQALTTIVQKRTY
ncbi:MAG: hypothetical protein S4CHLAM2_10140 [Chlamydiales bacterium]|nr:hypothetical protein [Chlamydiales bacterium]